MVHRRSGIHSVVVWCIARAELLGGGVVHRRSGTTIVMVVWCIAGAERLCVGVVEEGEG